MAILSATARLFVEKGFSQLSIEGIAAEAGVGKQTIYRWWPTKSDLVAEALIEGMLMPGHLEPRFAGTLRDDLVHWMLRVLAFVDDPQYDELLKSLLAAGASNPAIGAQIRDRLGADAGLAYRLENGAAEAGLGRRIEKGIAAGELAADAPISSIIELLTGAVVLRVVARSAADEGEAERLVDVVLGRYAPPAR